MAIVVSDTSPVRALQHLGLLPILEQIYGKVYIPAAVATELRKAGRRFPPLDLNSYPFFTIENPKDAARVKALELTLDEGESAAIVLALEKNADRVLIDEQDARVIAQKLGLTVVGVMGVLLEAKTRKHVASIKPLINDLQKNLDFHLSAQFIARVLTLAGE